MAFDFESKWTPTALTPETIPAEWMRLTDLFSRLNNQVGAADLAVLDLRRALSAGKVQSLALRNVGGKAHTIWQERKLPSEFWRQIKLKPLRDRVGNDALGFAAPTDRQGAASINRHPWHFFVWREDVNALWLDDTIIVKTKKARAESATRRQPQRDRVKTLLRERYPGGLPNPEDVSDSELCAEIEAAFRERKKRAPSDDTILRAAGRRK